MELAAIIPARYASTRFPGKPLVPIRGISMIQRVYESVSRLELLDQVVVATDDERIYRHVRSFGGEAVMTSPDHQSGTERCAEALEKLREYPDIVLNVQGDEPFIDPEHLRQILGCFEDSDTQIATLIKRIERPDELFNPNVPKVVCNERGMALYFSRSTIPYLRGPEPSEWLQTHAFYKHIGLYGYRGHVLQQIAQLPAGSLEQAEKLEQLRWLEAGYLIRVAETRTENLAIDTPEDLERLLGSLPQEA